MSLNPISWKNVFCNCPERTAVSWKKLRRLKLKSCVKIQDIYRPPRKALLSKALQGMNGHSTFLNWPWIYRKNYESVGFCKIRLHSLASRSDKSFWFSPRSLVFFLTRSSWRSRLRSSSRWNFVFIKSGIIPPPRGAIVIFFLFFLCGPLRPLRLCVKKTKVPRKGREIRTAYGEFWALKRKRKDAEKNQKNIIASRGKPPSRATARQEELGLIL